MRTNLHAYEYLQYWTTRVNQNTNTLKQECQRVIDNTTVDHTYRLQRKIEYLNTSQKCLSDAENSLRLQRPFLLVAYQQYSRRAYHIIEYNEERSQWISDIDAYWRSSKKYYDTYEEAKMIFKEIERSIPQEFLRSFLPEVNTLMDGPKTILRMDDYTKPTPHGEKWYTTQYTHHGLFWQVTCISQNDPHLHDEIKEIVYI